MTTKSKTRKAPAAKTTTPKAARKKGVLSIIRCMSAPHGAHLERGDDMA
jgi:hypothetical protein